MTDIVSLLFSSGTFFSLYLVLAQTLNLEYGYSGILNFGKVLFYGLGAFSTGLVVGRLFPFLYSVVLPGSMCSPSSSHLRLNLAAQNPEITFVMFLICIGVGALVAGAFGLLLAIPSLRIKEGFVLGIVLLASGEASRIVTTNYNPIICGFQGLGGIPNPFSSLSNSFLSNFGMSILIIFFAALVYVYVTKIVNSPYGRMMRAIRDDPTAADTYGKFASRSKTHVLIIASALSGIAGVLYVYYIGYISASDFIPDVTFTIWLMMILGGASNGKGVLLGTFIVTLLTEGTMILADQLQFFFSISLEINYFKYVLEGILLILILLYRPHGLISEKPIKTSAFDT